jgi:hypothetical protein
MTRSRRAETRPLLRAWAARRPGQLLGKGHPGGDFLEAYNWEVLEESPGVLRIRAHLPAHVRNPRGQLFGGFTPTYVDLVVLFTVRAGEQRIEGRLRTWLATTNLRVDSFEPIVGPHFAGQVARAHEFRRNALLRSRGHPGSFGPDDDARGGSRSPARRPVT